MNDYLIEFMENCGPGGALNSMSPLHFKTRERLVEKYAWAIPDDQSLEMIAECGPIVEIGAGTGYWAHLLRELGVDVVAYDIAPPGGEKENGWRHTETWTEVLEGGPEKAWEHPDRALFLCWPPYSDPMAFNALGNYQGDTLIYIGEDEWGCTGDEAFHKLMNQKFSGEWYDIPHYNWIHDAIFIGKRR